MKIMQFKLKIGTMRKADRCIVYPQTIPNRVEFQGARTFGIVDLITGEAVINYKGSNYKTGIHLSRPGTEVFFLSPELLAEITACIPQKGDEIGPGVIIG